MHYKNLTEAHEGDHVIAKDYNGKIVTGVITDLAADPKQNTCNCSVVILRPGGSEKLTRQTVGNLWLAADAVAVAEFNLSLPAVKL